MLKFANSLDQISLKSFDKKKLAFSDFKLKHNYWVIMFYDLFLIKRYFTLLTLLVDSRSFTLENNDSSYSSPSQGLLLEKVVCFDTCSSTYP